ncbi:MAG TPA: HEAT repeat domain-containing protein [Longimicrobiales bacterium]
MKLALLAVLAAALPVAAQQPPVGIVDVYGARTLSADEVRSAAGIGPGDSITRNTEQAVRARLMAALNVKDAHVAIVCCSNGQSIVYLGLVEQSDSAIYFANAPTGSAVLPRNIVQAEERFGEALQQAVLSGQAEEDDSLGHSLMRFPPAREAQQEFMTYALGNVTVLRDVLQNGSDAHQRALAAQVIAYAINKNAIIPDLVQALRDPDPEVRNNAMRALAVMASYAQRHPEAGLRIPYEPFVGMLNSPYWTDRNKAAMVLMSLTAARNPALMQQLRRTALPALTDMVYWQTEGHALPAAILLGRMGGLPDDAIMNAFHKDRNILIEAARNPI